MLAPQLTGHRLKALICVLCASESFAWNAPSPIPNLDAVTATRPLRGSRPGLSHVAVRKRFAFSRLHARITQEEEMIAQDDIIVDVKPVEESYDWQPWTEVELDARSQEWRWDEPRKALPPPRKPIPEEDMPLITELYLKEGGLEAYQDSFSLPESEETSSSALPLREPSDSGSSTTVRLPSALAEDGMRAATWLARRKKGTSLVPGVKSRAPIGTKPFLVYNAEGIEHYYDRNLIPVISRMVSAGTPLISFALRVLSDRALGRSKEMEATRARELRDVLSASGPTAIKVGQALSNRPDLVSPVYMNELQNLQDNVGAFDHKEALAIVERELGASIDEVFDRFSAEPVASASLGQVYRGRIRGMPEGKEVAVKVQRPGLASVLPVDMYVLRRLAALGRRQLKLRSDLVSIVDEFAERLFEEINYSTEAANAIRFKELYGDIDRLVIPEVYCDFSGRHVLTMEWIEGTKPPSADKPPAGRGGAEGKSEEAAAWQELINVGVQCNLKQLLDDGFFHADPHSGNLLRTTDGSLAYLDFGMMSSLSATRRYQLIASIVHLINRDYPLLARDFQVLGFLPEEFEEFDAMASELQRAFGEASGGDKLSNINFMKLADNLAGIAFRFPFRIPAYYSLIIRSLTILEGIALASNPDFKIVDAAYPYVARRLLFDSSPELQDALREIVMEPDTRRLKWSRLLALLGTQQGGGRRKKSQAREEGQGEGERGGEVNAEILRGVVEFLLADTGRPYIDALVEDLVETGDNLQLTAGVVASVASGGLLPPPADKPSLSRLQTFSQILAAVSRAAGSGVQRGLLSGGGGGPSLEERVSAVTKSVGIADREMQERALRETQRITGTVAVRLAELSARRALRTTTQGLLRVLEGPGEGGRGEGEGHEAPRERFESRLALRRRRRERAAAEKAGE